jgi:hypothetical protein
VRRPAKGRRAFCCGSWIVAAAAILSAHVPPTLAAHRRFDVRDSIETADFVEGPLWSPDGKWIAVATQRGLLPQGVTEATLWLFDATAVARTLKREISGAPASAQAAVRLSGAINGDGGAGFGRVLMRLTWDSTSRTLYFLGRDGRENRQLFRVSISGGAVTALTPPTQDVVDYAQSGGKLIYLAGPSIDTQKLWSSMDSATPDIVLGTGRAFEDLLYPSIQRDFRYMPTPFELWQIEGDGKPSPVLNGVTHKQLFLIGSYYPGSIVLAPDGQRAVIVAHAQQIPDSWSSYEVPRGLNGEPFHPDRLGNQDALTSDYSRARQYYLVDLEQGTQRPLLNAPIADFMRGG